MRNFCAAAAALSLLAASAFAAPLSPGKPAGVRKAQDQDNTVLYIVGLGVVAAGIAIAVSDNDNGTSQGTITTTPPTTTTSTTKSSATTAT